MPEQYFHEERISLPQTGHGRVFHFGLDCGGGSTGSTLTDTFGDGGSDLTSPSLGILIASGIPHKYSSSRLCNQPERRLPGSTASHQDWPETSFCGSSPTMGSGSRLDRRPSGLPLHPTG